MTKAVSSTSRKRPYVNYSYSSDDNLIASFGFELKNIKKDIPHYLENLQKNALNWHQRFFTTISDSPLDFSVVYKIRNNGNTLPDSRQMISISFLFFIKACKTDSLEEAVNTFIQELMVIFSPKKPASTDPYIFMPITEPDHLLTLTEIPEGCKAFDYIRNQVQLQCESKNMGFKANKKPAKNIRFIPQFFKPDFLSLNNIIQYISDASQFIDLSLVLAPFRFSDIETEKFKKLIERSTIVNDDFTREERVVYNRYLEMIFDNNTTLFFFQTKLTVSSDYKIGQSIHNTISDTFYGNIRNVKARKSSSEWQIPFVKGRRINSILPYVFPAELVALSFRLPVIKGDDIIWFTHQTNIFNFTPSELPVKGVKLGVKKTSQQQKEIYISEDDLSRHMYILGQTGVGKTTLLRTMILDQIRKGEGICVVDPHGDLVKAIMKSIPEERKKDIIFFDPTVTKDILINIIEVHPDFPEQRTFVFNELMKIFSDLYNMSNVSGPAFELYFKNSLFLIMERGGKLADLFPFFLDKDFREDVLRRSDQKFCVDFFRNAERITGEWSIEAFASYVTSKINRFVQDDFIGPIINHEKSTVNFREIIDNRKIFLIRLPKGRLGNDGVKFIGTVIFNRIIMAAFTRENIDECDRIPYNLYVDEFQNFTSDDVVTALSESRKYGLRLILANQTLSQIKSQITDIILGNVGSQIIFRPGVLDISKLFPYYNQSMTEQEMLSLPNFQAVARLLNENTPLKPFIFETINEKAG